MKAASDAIEAVRQAWATRSTPLKGALILVGMLWVAMMLSTGNIVGGTVVTAVCCGLIVALAHVVRSHWQTQRIDNPATVIDLAATKMVDTLEQDGSWFSARGHLIVTLAMKDFDHLLRHFDFGAIIAELEEAYLDVIRRFSARMDFTGRPFVTVEADKRQRSGTCRVSVRPEPDEQTQFHDSRDERPDHGDRTPLTQQQFQKSGRPPVLPPTVRESNVRPLHPDVVAARPTSTPHRPPTGWAAIPTRKKGPTPTPAPRWMTVPTTKTMPPSSIELVTDGVVLRTVGNSVSVGRSVTADIQISDHPQVSRVHGNLTFNDGVWWVAAYSPANPCLVNGMTYDGWRQLRDGDRITWGDFPGAPVSQIRYPTHQRLSDKRSIV